VSDYLGIDSFDGDCTGYLILNRALLPWLAVPEMRDMEMIITSTVSVGKKDNCRTRSPREFGRQK
jgi:hypothetical protein